MKTMFRLSNAVVLCLIFFLNSCKKEDPAPSAEEVNTKLLTSSGWKVQSVMIDGSDQTSLFSGLVLTFTASAYSATNGNLVWPASGTWRFANAEAIKVLRSDNMEITLVEINESKLVLSLLWNKTTFAGGRSSSLKGTHTFTFSK